MVNIYELKQSSDDVISRSLEHEYSAIIAELLKNNFLNRDAASNFYDIDNDDTLDDRNHALEIFEQHGYSWEPLNIDEFANATYLVTAPSGKTFEYAVTSVIDLVVAKPVIEYISLDDLLNEFMNSSKDFDDKSNRNNPILKVAYA